MSEPNLTCPYCRHVRRHFDYSDMSWTMTATHIDLDCPKCGKEYRVEVEANGTFSCWEIASKN